MIIINKGCGKLKKLVWLLLLAWGSATAQPGPSLADQIELANEYLNRNEVQKALDIFEKLQKNPKAQPLVHASYLQALRSTGQVAAEEKYLRKLIKREPQQAAYYLQLASTLARKPDDKGLARLQQDYVKQAVSNLSLTSAFGREALDQGRTDWAEAVYAQARQKLKDPLAFAMEMAEVYNRSGKTNEMLAEMVAYLDRDPAALPFITNTLQNSLSTKAQYSTLQALLLQRAQQYPNNSGYAEALLWLALQQRDFYGAWLQAKALDLRNNSPGAKSLEVAALARENHDYETAVEVYAYVASQYRNTPSYLLAQRLLVETREAQLKRKWPIDTVAIAQLIADYGQLIAQTSNPRQQLEPRRNRALLHGHYLNQPDTAIAQLQELLAMPGMNADLRDRCKLDLGDLHLLKDEPWESTLLYSQVEIDQKEAPLGHEAKLKNAQLSYYRGEFELAKDHLNVLKLATSREIANDALNLSLRIQDALAFDTAGVALRQFSRVELMLLQNQTNQALVALDTLFARYPGTSIQDEAYWLKARIQRRMQQYQAAIATLQLLQQQAVSGIYNDEAQYTIAQIYDQDLQDEQQAMAFYEELLLKFPGSIFVAESRKRFRMLRGDAIN